MEILDMKCAEYGNKIVEEIGNASEKNKIESMITKALGVLQEDGVYAFALYTKSKSGDGGVEKITARVVHDKACKLLKDDKIKLLLGSCNNFLDDLRSHLANDVDKLFLAKELLERTLVYARYHAKALNSVSRSGGV
ncbi:MAG: hypothetical protein B6D35_02860 [Candidatus Brocadia sp. UTAMX2]|jgi:hypothetical protein|nr:MAG: hypothetical protein B6D35_02860 [Candidatus Brocadia sp. UTAMX2]